MCKISMVRAAEAVQTTLANKFDAVFCCCNVMVITKTSFEELVTIKNHLSLHFAERVVWLG